MLFSHTVALKTKTGINMGVKHFTGESIHLSYRFLYGNVHGWILAKDRPVFLVVELYLFRGFRKLFMIFMISIVASPVSVS